jgi:hypothetical protein
VQGPQLELLLALALDYRFGLFVTCPLLLLALAAPLLDRGPGRRIPGLELAMLLGIFIALWLFFSGVNYTRLQFNTGIRYLSPIFPFLFVPAAVVLMRLPRHLVHLLGVLAIAEGWCLAMHRDVERGGGVFDPIAHVFLGGFKLPALTTVSRLGGPFEAFVAGGVSPLPLFALAGAIVYGIWKAPMFRRSE